MHELSIMQNIFEIVYEQAKANNLKKINKLKLKVGELAGVLPDALSFSFEVLSKGTIAEGADFEIEEVKVKGRCEKCSNEFRIKNYCFVCPNCKSTNIQEIAGRELLIDYLEVD